MKILVAGATGFLGAHIVRQLLKQKDHVFAACRTSSDSWRLEDVKHLMRLVEMDLLNTDSINKALTLCCPEAVINCAAYGVQLEDQDPLQAINVNIRGTYHLVDASVRAGVSRFIHIGSCSEYGIKNHTIREDELLEPTSIYGVTKAAASLMVLEIGRNKKMPALVVRPFNLWGLFEPSHRLVPQVIKSCLLRQPLQLTGGDQARDYTHVSDMAGLITHLLKTDNFPEGQIINAGSGSPVKLREFVSRIAGTLNGEERMLFGKLPYRHHEGMMLVPDVSKLTNYVSLKTSSEESFVLRVGEMAKQIRQRSGSG